MYCYTTGPPGVFLPKTMPTRAYVTCNQLLNKDCHLIQCASPGRKGWGEITNYSNHTTNLPSPSGDQHPSRRLHCRRGASHRPSVLPSRSDPPSRLESLASPSRRLLRIHDLHVRTLYHKYRFRSSSLWRHGRAHLDLCHLLEHRGPRRVGLGARRS